MVFRRSLRCTFALVLLPVLDLVACAADRPAPSSAPLAPQASSSASVPVAPTSEVVSVATADAPPASTAKPDAEGSGTLAELSPDAGVLGVLGEGAEGVGGLGGGQGNSLAPSDGARPNGPRPIVREGAVSVAGGLFRDLVRREVRRRIARVRYCYERALRVNPSMAGHLTVSFTIDKDGKVTSAAETASTVSDKSVGACIVHTFQQISFPKSDQGATRVLYPFVLSAAP